MRCTIREHSIIGKGDSNLVFPTCCLRTESAEGLFVLSRDEIHLELWQL